MLFRSDAFNQITGWEFTEDDYEFIESIIDKPEQLHVWLAFEDADEENAAMQVIPGSHKAGWIKGGYRNWGVDSHLPIELDHGQVSEGDAVSMNLKAGQLSLHDDKLVHGSGANKSPRLRAGLTIRYSNTEVKCDLSVNPHFKTYLARGEDKYQHNPVGVVPTQQYARPDYEQKVFESLDN